MNDIGAGTIAVIFTSQRTSADPEGYAAAAAAMDAGAAAMPGYRGIRTARDADGFGITISYWRDSQAAAAWRDDLDHRAVRERGRVRWYAAYEVVVTVVDRAYAWSAPTPPSSARAG